MKRIEFKLKLFKILISTQIKSTHLCLSCQRSFKVPVSGNDRFTVIRCVVTHMLYSGSWRTSLESLCCEVWVVA